MGNSKKVVDWLLAAVGNVFSSGCSPHPPMEPNVADRGSEFYRFQTVYFDSVDNQRHDKVWLAIPYRPVPAGGYPVVYLLDGNAVMASLSEKLLGELHAAEAPVLVAIGYDPVKSRNLDYTPPGEDMPVDSSNPAWVSLSGGGGHAFRSFLFDQLIPWVETQAASDPKKRVIWGHAFGGLFVLDTLAESSWFNHYFSAAPSLIWQNQRIVQQVLRADNARFTGQTVVLMAGDNTLEYSPALYAEAQQAEETLIALIKAKGADLSVIRYQGQRHQQVFASSLADALKSKTAYS